MTQMPEIWAWPPNKPGQPYGPQPKQESLFIYHMEPKDRPHNHPNDIILLHGGAGSGKSFRKGTTTIGFDGSIINIEDVQVGDLLMGPDSTPRKVLALGRGREVFYRVTPVKGDSFDCNESHILSLKRSTKARTEMRINKDGTSYLKPQRCPGPDILNVSVKEYLSWSKRKQQEFKLYRSGPISFENEQPLTIDPYILGLWLGDGSSSTFEITNTDPEVISAVLGYAKDQNCYVYNSEVRLTKTGRFRAVGLNPKMRQQGLLNNKHIPQSYKTASIQSRLALLAGLLDSDGHYQNKGHFEIAQKNRTLAEDILFLCRSLGLAAYLFTEQKCCVYKDEKRWGVYHRIHISGDLDRIPTRISRKQATPRQQKKDWLTTGFTLECLEEADYYGVVLDGDHLFLLGDFTVVHNTIAGIAEIIELLVSFPGCRAVVGGKNYPLLKRNVVEEFAQRFSVDGSGWSHPIITKKPSENNMVVFLTPVWDPASRSIVKSQLQFINLDKYEVARGFNADVIMIEEANLMAGSSFEEMMRRSRSRTLPIRQVILTMNPTGDRDWVHTKFSLRQFEPGYEGPPMTIGQLCVCHLCTECLNNERGEFEYVGGKKECADYTNPETKEVIPNRCYSWVGGHCPSCKARKPNACPGHQQWYRVILSKSADNKHNPDTYIQDMKASMDPERYRMFVLGEIFQVRTGKVYKQFSNANILPRNIPFNPEKEIIWTHDFNRDPMCSALWQENEHGVHIFDEIIDWDSTEERVAKIFVERYLNKFKGKVLLYGDPTSLTEGRSESRRTGFQIIHDYLKMYKFDVEIKMEKIPGKTKIGIHDRVNTLNAMLCNAKGERRIRINPSCEASINSLASVNWDEKGKEEDKNIDAMAKEDPARLKHHPPMTHPGCAIGYGVYKRHPIIKDLLPSITLITDKEVREVPNKDSNQLNKDEIPQVEVSDDPFLTIVGRQFNDFSISAHLKSDNLRERLESERKQREAQETERLRRLQELDQAE